MNIVGFGGAGCAFVSQLEEYSQYNIYKIDKGLPRKGNTYPVSAQSSHEEYEKNPPKLSHGAKIIDVKVVSFSVA